ncbi:MAG TPA: hypothetical protein ENN33_04980 [Ignavibacteria bacterium]|nr:hypothetical protein [Ignavibacteria bacterium]
MGLTIHYSGKFNPSSSLKEMVEEVKDIAEIYNWEYHIYETDFPVGSLGEENYDGEIYGIYIIPPNCEPVYLTFLSNGRMANEIGLKLWGNAIDPKEKSFLFMLFTKTQFGGSEIHKLIIHLLKYLKEKYFAELNVYDEGKYWETGDEKLLDEIFERYNKIFDVVETALNNIPLKPNESYEEYFKRILKIINKKK